MVSLERALSKLGLASRSQARDLISSGRVRVDGRLVTDPSQRVIPEAVRISIDGAAQSRAEECTILLHKPRGYVTTRSDPEGRKTICEALKKFDWSGKITLIRINNQRAAAKRKSGAEAGPEGSITKLQQAEFNQRLQNLAIDLEGASAIAWEGRNLSRIERVGRVGAAADTASAVASGFLRAQANTIEGGTSDIMRNILGERVLGLPKEPRSDAGPWKNIPGHG